MKVMGDAIIAERKKNEKFKSITDFLERIKHKNLNKKSMEALIKSGSMDEWGDRGIFIHNLEDMLSYNKESFRQENQSSLFGELPLSEIPGFKLKDAPPATQAEKL